MFERGTLVKLTGMKREYGTGLDRHWEENIVGYIVRVDWVTPNSGFALIDCITPVESLKGNPIKWLDAHTPHLVILERKPIQLNSTQFN